MLNSLPTFVPSSVPHPATRRASSPTVSPARRAPRTHPVMTTPPPDSGLTRSSVPVLIPDVVTVTDPDKIREICSSPEIGRPADGIFPKFIDIFHAATKFFNPADNEFFVGFHSDNRGNQVQRREVVIKQLEKGFSDEQIENFARLVDSDADVQTLGIACVKAVGSLILPLKAGEEVPDDVCIAAEGTLTETNDVFNPFKYLAARRRRLTVEKYVRSLLPDDPYAVDYTHNLGAATHGFARALLALRDTTQTDTRAYFSTKPLARKVLRCPLKETTLNGMFDQPLIPDKTFLTIDIGAGLEATNDDLFFFGTGLPERQCAFRTIAFETLDKIQAARPSIQASS